MQGWRDEHEKGQSLRAMDGVLISRTSAAVSPRPSQSVTWEDRLTCDAGWGVRARRLRLISTDACLGASDGWVHAPVPTVYREIPSGRCRDAVGKAYGLKLCAELLLPGKTCRGGQRGVVVLCLEKPFLDGFLAALEEAIPPEAEGLSPPQRFVLLLVNGGDVPLVRSAQRMLAAVGVPRGLARCFATNLHTPESETLAALFSPLPLGIPRGGSATCDSHEALLAAAHARAPPWAQRDGRLLCAPMRISSRARAAYLRALSQPEFAQLVRFVPGPLPIDRFCELLASHRATLSPPGRGFDCFRTWQALAVGTVPLVAADAHFDGSLLRRAGAVELPPPEELTPTLLSALLAQLVDPAASTKPAGGLGVAAAEEACTRDWSCGVAWPQGEGGDRAEESAGRTHVARSRGGDTSAPDQHRSGKATCVPPAGSGEGDGDGDDWHGWSGACEMLRMDYWRRVWHQTDPPQPGKSAHHDSRQM